MPRLTSYHNFSRRLILSYIAPFLPDKGNCLDIGCGSGFYVNLLKKKGVFAVGIDLHMRNIRYGGNFVVGAGGELPFRSASVDAVLLNQVLEHIKDDKKAVREIRRVLNSGGIAIVTVPTFSIEEHFDSEVGARHAREGYSMEGITSLFESQGFEILEKGYYMRRISRFFHWLWWGMIELYKIKKNDKERAIPKDVELPLAVFLLYNLYLHTALLLSLLDRVLPTRGYGIFMAAEKKSCSI